MVIQLEMKFLIQEFQQLKCLVYVQNKLSSLGRRREGKAKQSKAKQAAVPTPPSPPRSPPRPTQVPQVLHQHQHRRRRRQPREPTQRRQDTRGVVTCEKSWATVKLKSFGPLEAI